MLQSISEHLWTNDPTKNDFLAPAYDPGNHFGGSLSMWPERNVDGDSRSFLGFWGTETDVGGCCHYTKNDGSGWGKKFTMYYSLSVFDESDESAGLDCVGADAMECSKCACLQTPASPCSADDSTWCYANLAGVGMNCMQYVACPPPTTEGPDVVAEAMTLMMTECASEIGACMTDASCGTLLGTLQAEERLPTTAEVAAAGFQAGMLFQCYMAAESAGSGNGEANAAIDLYTSLGGAHKVGGELVTAIQTAWDTCDAANQIGAADFGDFMANDDFKECLEGNVNTALLQTAFAQYNTEYDFSGASQLVSGFAAVAVVAALTL